MMTLERLYPYLPKEQTIVVVRDLDDPADDKEVILGRIAESKLKNYEPLRFLLPNSSGMIVLEVRRSYEFNIEYKKGLEEETQGGVGEEDISNSTEEEINRSESPDNVEDEVA